jgi:predicted transcriptional regulator
LSDRRRRDSNQIKYEILMAAIRGSRKTNIMYESGLNLKQLNFYLEQLLEGGALEYYQAERRYSTTERGKSFLRVYDQYREAAEHLNRQEAALEQFFSTTAKRPIVAQWT